MTYTKERVLTDDERAFFEQIPLVKAANTDNTSLLNAVNALRADVHELRALIDTPERRLRAAGLHYAETLP